MWTHAQCLLICLPIHFPRPFTLSVSLMFMCQNSWDSLKMQNLGLTLFPSKHTDVSNSGGLRKGIGFLIFNKY